MKAGKVIQRLTRKKVVNAETLSDSKLIRHLGVIDLTALGVGSTLGVGIYVLAGTVSKDTAGPAVVFSFLIAAVASVFAGLCYAEFGARVPKAGSAYVYSYVCVGEFIAFVIGWNLILEYMIGAASVARGLSGYIDALVDHVMEKKFKEILPIHVAFFSPYPDFFAFGMIMIFNVALSFGVKESSKVNNVFTLLNLAVVVFAIGFGLSKADLDNWKISEEDADGRGKGGFFPYGINGVIKGAATCFYGFVGFDCVATAGEEAKNPQRSIPLSIIFSLLIVFLAYFGVSAALTLMIPYYDLDTDSPLPVAFDTKGAHAAKWIVSIGAIFGLLASIFGALFPLPRIVYAMSSDGLLFRFLGKIHPRFKTPVTGTIVVGLITAFIALIFDLEQLVKMMSIGTLMAYSIVAACVLLLRYAQMDEEQNVKEKYSFKYVLKQLLNLNKLKQPIGLTASIVTWAVFTYFVLCLSISALIVYAGKQLLEVNAAAVTGMTILCVLLLFTLFLINIQPTSEQQLSFKVPLVPLLPGVSIFINMYLMMMLDVNTWIRFVVWMAIGLAIYFGYGIWDEGYLVTRAKHCWKH